MTTTGTPNLLNLGVGTLGHAGPMQNHHCNAWCRPPIHCGVQPTWRAPDVTGREVTAEDYRHTFGVLGHRYLRHEPAPEADPGPPLYPGDQLVCVHLVWFEVLE